MSSVDSNKSIKLCALVALPGPVTGMTLATRYVVNFLSLHFSVTVCDLARGYSKKGIVWKIRKFTNGLMGCLSLLVVRMRGVRTLLLAPNAGWGLVMTVLHVWIAKLLGMRVILHHHVYSYCSRKSRLMSLVQWALNESDLNLVLNDQMGRVLGELYCGKAQALELPYGYMTESPEASHAKAPVSKPIVLGHLSNLTIEKGLEDVIETAVELKKQGIEVRLILAGGLAGAKEKEVFDRAQSILGDSLEYLGPVYGESKASFFSRINYFLFPSRYVNEAQPVVIVEALATGVPVAATPIGCIPGMIRSEFGWLIESQQFAKEASKSISLLSDDALKYEEMSVAALSFSNEFRCRSLSQLQVLRESVESKGL